MKMHPKLAKTFVRLFGPAYILLIGLVMPFICWGAWAHPGHPHPGPHFVFTAPPAANIAEHDAPGDEGSHHAPEPVGQSTPDTTVITLLLVVAWGLALAWQSPREMSDSFLRLVGAPQYSLSVPSPPPRWGAG